MEKRYNYNLKNIGDWRKEFNKEILDKTIEYQNKYNFDIGAGKQHGIMKQMRLNMHLCKPS